MRSFLCIAPCEQAVTAMVELAQSRPSYSLRRRWQVAV
jgi:hypothetical protein